MKKLIQQIRSFGSLCKDYGVHVSSMRKPEVSFKAPTYSIGGSDYSFTRQGGFILLMGNILLFVRQLLVLVGQVRDPLGTFISGIMFLRENADKIEGFDYRLNFLSPMINLDQEVYCRYKFKAAS